MPNLNFAELIWTILWYQRRC